MTEKLLSLLLAAVLLFSSSALGEETPARVFDEAGLYSDSDTKALEKAIQDFQESTGYDFAILVSDVDYGYDDYQLLCDDFYQDNALGLGMNHTAMICYLDFSEEGYYYIYIAIYGDLLYLMGDEDVDDLVNGAADYINKGEVTTAFMWVMGLLSNALGEIGEMNPNTRVYDYAGFLGEEEAAQLETAIADFRSLSGADFLFLSTYTRMDGNEDGEYVAEFFDRHGFGDGENRSGAAMYLDLDLDAMYFDYYIHNFGDMDTYVSQESLNDMLDTCVPLMNDGEFLAAVLTVLDAYTENFE